jgi:hypothetical protein
VIASIGWVPTELEPRRMIAVPTLEAVRALLRAHAAGVHRVSRGGATVSLRVDEHAALSEVGGVARVEGGARGAVAIARIGRTSFVAYQLEPQGLRELPVEVDPADGCLLVRCDGRN